MKTKPLIHSLVLGVLAASTTVRADVVTDWNNAALNSIRAGRTSPPIASRGLAILHASIYDAVNGIDRSHESYLIKNSGPASSSKEAAASAAAHLVLLALFPTNAPAYDALHASTLAAIPDGPRKNKGIAWGESVARQILAARANDGATTVVPPLPALGPGDWVPTPAAFAPYLLPQWGQLTCFTMTSGSQFRPPGPPALTSEAWATAYNEVKAYGAAVGSVRTADQTEVALFWADGAGTETPPGHWNSIAQDVGAALGNTMEENARLFALINLAMADAAIASWDAKYHYHNWRPVTAIRAGETDGNDATVPDPAWTPLIGTPPFPDYISGHSTFSGAAATVLAMFYGTDDISFTTGSDFMPSVTRSFTSFSAAATEAMLSRLYGGIHYRFANEDGMATGQSIGEWTSTRYLQAKGNRSRK